MKARDGEPEAGEGADTRSPGEARPEGEEQSTLPPLPTYAMGVPNADLADRGELYRVMAAD